MDDGWQPNARHVVRTLLSQVPDSLFLWTVIGGLKLWREAV